MSVAKQGSKSKQTAKAAGADSRTPKKPAVKSKYPGGLPGFFGSKHVPAKKVKPAASKKGQPAVVRPPLTDEEVGPIPGLPSEAAIEQHVGNLSSADKGRFTRIRRLLAERLGSHAAARVWLTTPGRGFDGTPLDAIRDGMADLVLEVVKDQSSPNPSYA